MDALTGERHPSVENAEIITIPEDSLNARV